MLRIAKLSSLIFGGLLLVSFARAEGMSGVNVNGHLDVFYTNDSNQGNGLQHAYGSDHDDFGIGAAQVAFSGTSKDVDWYLDFVYGNQFVGANATDDQPLAQAYLTKHFNDQVSLTVGRMFSNFGFEGIYAKDNWNYSRSLAFQFSTPKFAEGAALKYSHDSGFGAGLFYYDGSNVTNDADKTHATSVQLSYGQNNWGVVYNYYNDKDNDNNSGFAGNIEMHDISGTWDINNQFSVALNYMMGEIDENNIDTEWSSIAVYGKYMINKKFSVAARVEFWTEEDGNIIGNNTAGSGSSLTEEEITSITATLAHYCESGSEMRLEVRQDTADDEIWMDDEGKATDDQTTITAAWIHNF